jgi:hypothetical protein
VKHGRGVIAHGVGEYVLDEGRDDDERDYAKNNPFGIVVLPSPILIIDGAGIKVPVNITGFTNN